MRHLDLFSGVGGFSLGFERAGFETVAFSEVEKFPCKVLAKRWPEVPNFGDVSEITEEDLLALGEIDVVTFGSPCQDWSVAGKRLGLEGHRSSLFHEAIRIIRIAKPGFAVFENVPGLFSSAGGWDFAVVLDELAESGAMDIAWSVLDAQWFGVPQRRRRVFLVTDFGGERAGEILSIAKGVCRDTPPSREAGQEAAQGTTPSVASTLGVVPWADDTDRMTFVPEVANSVQASAGHHGHSSPRGDGSDNLVPEVAPFAVNVEHGLAPHGSMEGKRHVDSLGHDEYKGKTLVGVPEVAGGLTTRYGKGVNTTADDGAVIPVVAPESRSNYYSGHDGDEGRLVPVSVRGEGVVNALTSEGHDASEDGEGRGTPILAYGITDDETSEVDLMPTLPTPSASGGGHPPAVAFAENQRGEVRTSETHPQLTAGGGKPGQGYPTVALYDDPGRFDTKFHGGGEHGDLHPVLRPTNPATLAATAGMAVRRLTPLECERLQGFPDRWTDIPGGSDSGRYRAMGNAVAVPVVEWVAKRMAREINQLPPGSCRVL